MKMNMPLRCEGCRNYQGQHPKKDGHATHLSLWQINEQKRVPTTLLQNPHTPHTHIQPRVVNHAKAATAGGVKTLLLLSASTQTVLSGQHTWLTFNLTPLIGWCGTPARQADTTAAPEELWLYMRELLLPTQCV